MSSSLALLLIGYTPALIAAFSSSFTAEFLLRELEFLLDIVDTDVNLLENETQ